MIRTTATISIVVLAMTSGCYRSHERAAEPRARPDAHVPDSALPPPSCRVRCEPAELVAMTRTELWRPAYLITMIVTDGAPFVLVNTTVPDPRAELESAYVPFRVAPGTTDLVAPATPVAPRTHSQLSAASVREADGALRVIGLESDPSFRFEDIGVRAGLALFSRSGEVVSEFEPIATAPFELPLTGDTNAGAVFGRGARDIAAFSHGRAVHAWDISGGLMPPEPPLVELVSLSDDGGQTPLSGAVLDDGRIVIAGGGAVYTARSGSTPLARTAFLAIGHMTDAPLTPVRLAGLRNDPTPLVAAESPGFALVRYQAESGDLVRSTIHVVHADENGVPMRESLLRTVGGARPLATSVFGVGERAGVVWTERATDSAEVDVHVVPPGLDDGCDTIEAEPIVRVPEMPTREYDLVSTAGADGIYLALFVPGAVLTDPVIHVYRVGSCTVER